MSVDRSQLPQGVPAGATVADYVARKWGRAVRTVPPVPVSVGVTPTQLCKNNPRRFQLYVINLTNATMYELFGDTVSAINGFPIAPLGGSIIYSADEDGEIVAYDHWAICPVGPLNLVVVEVETI